MYCAAVTVASITGWTPDQVWLHVRALREAKGQRVTRHPRGGICQSEYEDALKRAGWEVVSRDHNRRMRYGEWCRTIGRHGVWMLHQHRHVFAYRPGKPIRYPNAMLIGWDRVQRRKG